MSSLYLGIYPPILDRLLGRSLETMICFGDFTTSDAPASWHGDKNSTLQKRYRKIM